MFLSCKNFCTAEQRQSQLIVFETTMNSNLNQKKADKYVDLSQFEAISNIVYEKIVKSNYQRLVKELSGTNKKFTDSEFPPNGKSLGEHTDSRGRKIVWKRIQQINKNSVFFDSIDPGDIMQGNLGDCYFLSSIAALAEVPDRIRKIFGSTEMNPNGFYMAHINVSGICREVVVDDYFPVYEPLDTLVFAKPKDSEIWVMILEKIWAKLRGSYGNISQGFPHEVLTTFTNAPCFYYEIVNTPYDREKIWGDLLEAQKQNYAVCCGSKKKLQPELGIVPLHTYTLLASYEIQIAGTIHRVCKIRNPWAYKEYQGQCSQYDKNFWSKVDANTIKHVGHGSQKQDGVFFMTYNKFIECFDSIDIAHTKIGYSYNFQSFYTESNQSAYFEVDIKMTKAECYFTLHQKNIGRGYGYGRCTLVIGKKIGKDSYLYIDSKMQQGFPTLTSRCLNLQAGTYIVYCKCEWQDKGAHRLTLSTYSPSIIDIGITKSTLNPQFLQKVMFNHAYNNPNKQLLGSNNQWLCMQILYKQGGYAYIAAAVQGNKKILFDFSPQDFLKAGFKVKGPLGKMQRCKIVAKQGQPFIILCKIKADVTQQQQLIFPPSELKISQSI